MNIWYLPTTANIGGCVYKLHTDFRDILDIFRWLSREELPLWTRWQIAIALFYSPQVPGAHWAEAADFFIQFVNCGQPAASGPKLFDWQQDADLILSDVNRVAGKEIRDLPYLHWWTFLSYFHSIGEGQLSAMIGLRRKLMQHKKPESWEQELYRANRHRIRLEKPLSDEEQAQRDQLNALLH